MIKYSKFVLSLIFVFCLFPSGLGAACGMKPYEFHGEIIDGENGQRVSGAVIYTFLDDQSHINSNGYETSYPDFTTSSIDGRFVAISFFNTNTPDSFTGVGHDCLVSPKWVVFVVSAEGYETTRLKFKIPPHKDGMNQISIDLDEPIRIPPAFRGYRDDLESE